MDIATMQSIWSKLNSWVSGLKDLKTVPDYTHHPLKGCTNCGKPGTTIPDTCYSNTKNYTIVLADPIQNPVYQNDADSYILPITFSSLQVNGTVGYRCASVQTRRLNPNEPLVYNSFPPITYSNGVIAIFVQWTGSILLPSSVYFTVEPETPYESLVPDITCDYDAMYHAYTEASILDVLVEPFKVEILKQLFQGLGQ